MLVMVFLSLLQEIECSLALSRLEATLCSCTPAMEVRTNLIMALIPKWCLAICTWLPQRLIICLLIMIKHKLRSQTTSDLVEHHMKLRWIRPNKMLRVLSLIPIQILKSNLKRNLEREFGLLARETTKKLNKIPKVIKCSAILSCNQWREEAKLKLILWRDTMKLKNYNLMKMMCKTTWCLKKSLIVKTTKQTFELENQSFQTPWDESERCIFG